MDLKKVSKYWYNKLKRIRNFINGSFLIFGFILSLLITSCETERYGEQWVDENSLTICQFLKRNQEEFSKSYRLLEEGKMLSPLCGYNPYGENFTLFLPTDEAIDQFIEQNPNYVSFEDMLQDTGFIYNLTRYHTLKRKVHTDEFPDGALMDSTITGERLAIGFFTDGDNQIIKVNKKAPIIQPNLDMTNGYIHVISEVLQQTEISGYDWLQQQEDYSILAKALELSGVKKRLWWDKYTILAEPDSVYHRIGIKNIEDLKAHIATPGLPLSNRSNYFHRYAAFHLVGGMYYLNDFHWGSKKYATMANMPITINVGVQVRINPGVETTGIIISESGDTTAIDYVLPIWENCNNVTRTGPVHSISDLLFFEPLQ